MSGFGLAPVLFKVSILWKNGFAHSYEQKLTVKQLASERERLAAYRWIEQVEFEELDEV